MADREKLNGRTIALARLSRREYSSLEMKAYLESKGLPEIQVEQVVRELCQERLIDDARYSTLIARQQVKSGMGPGKVLIKLRQKGVLVRLQEAQQLFDQASDRSEADLAFSVLERHFPRARDDPKELARAYRALLRRGFSPDITRSALKQLTGSNGPDGLLPEWTD